MTAIAGLTDSAADVSAAIAQYDAATEEFTVEFIQEYAFQLVNAEPGLIAVDCAIGFSRALARVAEFPPYRELIRDLANGGRSDLLVVRAPATASSPFSRSSPRHIARDLRLTPDELLRECDKATKSRMHLDTSLSVRHTRRVGRSSLMLLQALSRANPDRILLWPFDGHLPDLAAGGLPVIAEACAQEAEAQMSIGVGSGTGKARRNPGDRRSVGAAMVAAYLVERIRLSDAQVALMEAGFTSVYEFDAALILVAIVQTLRKGVPEPEEAEIRTVEGWVLGQRYPRDGRAPTPLQLLTPLKRHAYRYAVKAVECSSDGEKVRLEFACPDPERGRGAINIICGLNNSGKSFLLDQIRRSIDGNPHNSTVRIEPPPPTDESRVLFISRGWAVANEVGVVNLGQTAASLSLSPHLGEYRRVGLAMLVSQILPRVSPEPGYDADTVLTDPKVRRQIELAFDIEQTVYRCTGEPILVARLEQLLGARLYFRCANRRERNNTWTFEFVLVDRDGMTIPFKQWSEGQKIAFYVLTALHFFEPEVVLFDEIENHLHPAMISAVLEALRAHPTQAIVATHHPHLVFSRFADRVFYLETQRPGAHLHPPERLPYSKRHMDKGFPRSVAVIDNDLERIGTVYKLFSQTDEQLLRHAGYLESQATLVLLEAIARVFDYPPVPETRRALPDAQTQQLADRFRGVLRGRTDSFLRVLDYGSGVGRQVAEMGKLSAWQLGGHIKWTCYDPDAENVRRLQQKVAAISGVYVTQDAASLPESSFDVCVLANVLHELDPKKFAAAIVNADRLVSKSHGSIAILELYPLLHPEAYAVPYEAATLLDIFHAIGFVATSGSIAVRTEAQAYWIWARQSSAARPSLNGVQQVVETAWEAILKRVLSAYAAIGKPETVAEHVQALSYFTTVTSIASWRQGHWAS